MKKTSKPWYLTTVLVLALIFNVLNIWTLIIFPEGGLGDYNFPLWYGILSIIFEALTIIGISIVFWQKKFGLYLALIVAIVSVCFDFAVIPDQALSAAIGTLAPLLIIYLCARPVWKNFK
jgi:hypothetical protein